MKAFQAEMEKTRNESGRREEGSSTSKATEGTTGIEDKVKQLSVQEEEGVENEPGDGRSLASYLFSFSSNPVLASN